MLILNCICILEEIDNPLNNLILLDFLNEVLNIFFWEPENYHKRDYFNGFTLKKGYARNICNFSQDDPLTHFFTLSVLSIYFLF